MKHFEVEEIAKFAEGHVSESERELFIAHLAECGDCFKAYADTLKFVQEDSRYKLGIKLPGFNKIKKIIENLLQKEKPNFKIRRLVMVPTFALIILLLIIMPFLISTIHNEKILSAQIKQIQLDLEYLDRNSFSPVRDETTAAVRSGILVEDLSLLIKSGKTIKSNKRLYQKILLLLTHDLKVFADDKNPITGYLQRVEKKNLKDMIRNIKEIIESRSCSGLFQLGRFIEQGILTTFEKKSIDRKDIDLYTQIAERYKLPKGVCIHLEKLKNSPEINESKRILRTIKEIIFS